MRTVPYSTVFRSGVQFFTAVWDWRTVLYCCLGVAHYSALLSGTGVLCCTAAWEWRTILHYYLGLAYCAVLLSGSSALCCTTVWDGRTVLYCCFGVSHYDVLLGCTPVQERGTLVVSWLVAACCAAL
jgi:hypothetical protein